MEAEWVTAMTEGTIREVNAFDRGLAQKFEVIFESGHICSGKPIYPEGWFGLRTYPKVEWKE